MSSAAPHIVFAGGGTGGHLFPGLAVAAALRERCPSARITFLTTTRPLDANLLAPTGYAQVTQSITPVPSSPLKLPAFVLRWVRNVSAARRFMRQERVDAVLGLGGYAAGPPVAAARQCGIPAAILNPDAVPGRANRWLGQRCDLVVLQWDVSRRHFPRDADCRQWGCPVREAIRTATTLEQAECRRSFDLAPDRPVLLVTGASQGARTINEALPAIWPSFNAAHPGWQVLHLSGEADATSVREAYAAIHADARVLSFTHEMHRALVAADAVVSRAGASTLAELTILGKPSILVPYPWHRDRHQHHNAQVLVDAGAALIVEDLRDAKATAPALSDALLALGDDATRARMAAAAHTLARPDAAGHTADWLLTRAAARTRSAR